MNDQKKLIKMDSILKRAHRIVFERAEEKDRQYGDFEECMQKAADIATVLCGKNIDVKEVYKITIAMKLARESYQHKEDNLLDTIAYLAALNESYKKNEK